MDLFAKSLAARILVGLAALIVVGMIAMTLAVSARLSDLAGAQIRENELRQSKLLSLQMAGGVKWKKSESVAKVYAPAIEGESMLTGVYVEGADGSAISRYQSPRSAPGAADLFDAWPEDTEASDGAAIAETGDSVLIRREIVDPKSGEVIGWAAFEWNQSQKAAVVREVTITSATCATLFVVLVLSVAAWLVKTRASRPIGEISEAMSRLAEGDTSIETPHLERRDEVGSMASAVEVFLENAVRMERLNEEKAAADQEAERARIEILERDRAERTAADERARVEAEEKKRQFEEEKRKQAKADDERRNREDEERQKAEAQRAEVMGKLREAFGAVISASARGDFSVRVDAAFEDEVMQELADGLNQIADTVAKGLGETCDVLDAVSHRGLSRRVKSGFEGEFATLKEGVNLTADTLSRIVNDLQDATNVLESQSNAVREGFEDLSDRTSSQAASVEETSAAVNLLSRSVNQNAERAGMAKEKAMAASVAAANGGEVMNGVSKAMDKVARSSEEIASIVDLIDGIAFQTNLLSLNASVEAARAGEAGSGFAVVAAEVRNLAQSAANSSAEIRLLIDRSRDEIQTGVDLVKNASAHLDTIVGGVSDVSELIVDISEDTNEQAMKLSEVNEVVTSFDQITQQNAQLVEKSTGALSQTATQISAISEIAQSFRLERDAPEEAQARVSA